ncbi:unnamed protein product [Phytomonas sp. Hart1]|nr:unnamed protein product [Phytomonas sp. Hart1]|eukprot:CCW71892.1 unnamed protein product [Phytomonas sp. isolate Hart1]
MRGPGGAGILQRQHARGEGKDQLIPKPRDYLVGAQRKDKAILQLLRIALMGLDKLLQLANRERRLRARTLGTAKRRAINRRRSGILSISRKGIGFANIHSKSIEVFERRVGDVHKGIFGRCFSL